MAKSSKSKTGSKSTVGHKVEVIHVSTSQVAYLFGISDRQVRNWVNQMKCPKLDHGLFDLKAVLDWWIESDMAAVKIDDSSGEISDVKLEYWKWKAEAERIKVETLQGKLIPEQEIGEQWSLRLAAVSSGLDMLPFQVAPHLEMSDQKSIIKVLAEKIWNLKDNFCRTGKFCLPVKEEE